MMRLCLHCEIGDVCLHEPVDRCAVERAILVAYELGYREGSDGADSRRAESDGLLLHDVGRIAGAWDSSPPNLAGLKELDVP